MYMTHNSYYPMSFPPKENFLDETLSIANFCKNVVFGARITWHHPHLRSKIGYACSFGFQVMHPLFRVKRCLEGFLMYRMIGDSIRT